MQIIKREPFANGGYPPIQSWSGVTPPEGYASVPDTLDTAAYFAHNGFVTLTVEGNTVTAMEANTDAWEAWKATLPDPSEALAEEARAKRDALLAASDWTQVLDAPIDADTREAYRVYRQALRDIPEQTGFPGTIDWPVEPASVKATPDPVDEAVDVLLGGESNA